MNRRFPAPHCRAQGGLPAFPSGQFLDGSPPMASAPRLMGQPQLDEPEHFAWSATLAARAKRLPAPPSRLLHRAQIIGITSLRGYAAMMNRLGSATPQISRARAARRLDFGRHFGVTYFRYCAEKHRRRGCRRRRNSRRAPAARKMTCRRAIRRR